MTLRLLISSGLDYHRLAVATLAPTKLCFAEKLCSCAICRSAAPQLQEAPNGSKWGAAANVMAGQRTDSCFSYRSRARPPASTGDDRPEIYCTRITRSDETWWNQPLPPRSCKSRTCYRRAGCQEVTMCLPPICLPSFTPPQWHVASLSQTKGQQKQLWLWPKVHGLVKSKASSKASVSDTLKNTAVKNKMDTSWASIKRLIAPASRPASMRTSATPTTRTSVPSFQIGTCQICILTPDWIILKLLEKTVWPSASAASIHKVPKVPAPSSRSCMACRVFSATRRQADEKCRRPSGFQRPREQLASGEHSTWVCYTLLCTILVNFTASSIFIKQYQTASAALLILILGHDHSAGNPDTKPLAEAICSACDMETVPRCPTDFSS